MNSRIQDEIRDLARPALRPHYYKLRTFLDVARIWKWQLIRFSGDAPFDVVYVGRDAERHVASGLFACGSTAIETGSAAFSFDLRKAFIVSELPLPDSLKVQGHLTSLVPLDAPMAEILGRFDPELRQRIRKLSADGKAPYRWRRVTDSGEIERIYNEMLVPFANERHGDEAVHPDLGEVTRLARQGRLDLLLHSDQPVGAHLGYTYEHRGTRRFVTERFGYPREIFSDPKRLAEVNMMNAHLACTHAHLTEHRYYDMGISLARPDGGLLQFKRRRHTTLETSLTATVFHVIPPMGRVAQGLASVPLFSASGDNLVLNVGVRATDTDERLVKRFHEWGWGGISTVRLYTEREVSPRVLDAIRERYTTRGAQTSVEVVRAIETT